MPTQDSPDDLHPEVTLPPAFKDPDETVSTTSPAAASTGAVGAVQPDRSGGPADRDDAGAPDLPDPAPQGDVAGETTAPEGPLPEIADGPVGSADSVGTVEP